MSSNNDSIGKTITVTVLLCVICSVVVSAAAVLLKPMQVENQEKNRKANILAVAGISDPNKNIDEMFQQISTEYVELDTGKLVEAPTPKYDSKVAAKDPELGHVVPSDEDIASIKFQANVKTVYLIKDEQGNITKVVLPVHGYGLWSTLWGFIAITGDNFNTVSGFGFYEQQETPGLGGEVDNPRWKALWNGKKIYDPNDWQDPKLQVVKGSVDKSTPENEYKVDGLSGATLTSNGVSNLVKFWLGEHGYAKFLANLRAGEVNNG